MFRSVCVALTLLVSTAALAKPATEAEYQAKLKELKQTMAQLQKELAAVKSDRDTLQNDLQKSEVDISTLLKKVDALQGELEHQKKQLTQLNQQRAELRLRKQAQEQQIGRQINAAYRLGGQSQIKLILNQQQPDQIARLLKYYDYFLNAHVSELDDYLKVLAGLDQVEADIAAKTVNLEQNRAQLDRQLASLSQSQARRQQTLQRLNSTIASKDQELQQKAEDQRRLEKLLDELLQALAYMNLPGENLPFSKVRGKIPWPVKGTILKGYGSRRDGGGMNWEGVLIGAPEGQSVRAVHHGRVVFSDYLRGHGMLIIVDHGEGFMSLYAHNQSLLLEPGDWVNPGDPVARVGNTGGQSVPAVYFEIRQRGRPVNPALWCRS